METKRIDTDILIIGGGTAGCYGAMCLAQDENLKILVAEKANIKRSGCLAAGVNAINSYVPSYRTYDEYVDYTRNDACKIVREDLLYTVAQGFNDAAHHLEKLGLVIQKDSEGNYAMRGRWNVKINGENIKPIMAKAVAELDNVTVLNHVNIADLVYRDNRVLGAYGFGVSEEVIYKIRAKAVLMCTGGAAGLYRPNNPGFSRHKMWYSPFNTGAGFAMGIKAGAEMTTFEMRFIALRCKDTIAPTGTIALGVGGKEINALGKVYEGKYGLKTCDRVYGTLRETLEGRGPCYINTKGIGKAAADDLKKAYLNMAPSQTLKWIEAGKDASEADVEIEGTEPYIVGGHTASGYWVDTGRATTVKGLFAAGDVAGGSPKKYVTGAMAEAKIASGSIVRYLEELSEHEGDGEAVERQFDVLDEELNGYLSDKLPLYGIDDIEDAMQKIMDTYAGGIGSNYQYSEKGLEAARYKIENLEKLMPALVAKDMHELMQIYEIRERITVCKTLLVHMEARRETRWHSFGENQDHPYADDKHWLKYVNTKLQDGEIRVIFRDLVKRYEYYEHTD
ncbi:MAG: adenylyl-sulfate reductase subunit alpha [Lachnospiraceae bacterium]|nr:adenylyl-sulfate reductase subunit alpha [Lachnospiraceae bacterium]